MYTRENVPSEPTDADAPSSTPPNEMVAPGAWVPLTEPLNDQYPSRPPWAEPEKPVMTSGSGWEQQYTSDSSVSPLGSTTLAVAYPSTLPRYSERENDPD